jgi:deazaflavin-dependent oxidoreductase (nitroreductase family)
VVGVWQADGMGTDQHVEQVWATPTIEEIPAITKAHVAGLEATDADAAWVLAGMHHIVITTVGRKTGAAHTVALPFWRDPDGQRIVVASFAGAAQHPSWYFNLADRTANPAVHCRVQHGTFWSVPEILEGDEHARIWALLTADRAWYDGYQAKTERTIPLVRFPETRSAA